MREQPILAHGIIRKVQSDRVYEVELPNGKCITGHLPNPLAKLSRELIPGVHVRLEMTPFDFEKGRIAGIVIDADA